MTVALCLLGGFVAGVIATIAGAVVGTFYYVIRR